MWEYFAETEPPSKMDLYTTTIGGIYLGELTHRIGEIFMHKIKKPFPKHALTALVNPMSQVNLLMVKESRQEKKDTSFNPLIRGQFAIGGTVPIGTPNNNIWGTGAYMGVSLVYGDLFSQTKKKYKPFDYFTLDSWLNMNFKDSNSVYFSMLSSAPLVVKHLNNNSVLSVSQQYDFLTSNVYKIGSIGITADYSWQHQWTNSSLAASLKAGYIILGSSQSEVVKYIYDSTEAYFFRDYIFGNGITAEAEVLFKTKNFGKIAANLNKWVIYADDTKGMENLMLVIVEYDYPIWRKLNIGFQGNYYVRKADYDYFPAFRKIKKDYFDFRALISLRFQGIWLTHSYMQNQAFPYTQKLFYPVRFFKRAAMAIFIHHYNPEEEITSFHI